MSLTTESYTRNVYTVLMFLSDVGGLYGILLPLGSMLVSMVGAFVGSGLERFVAGQLFYFEKKCFQVLSADKATPIALLKDKLGNRRPAMFHLFGHMSCCTKKKRL